MSKDERPATAHETEDVDVRRVAKYVLALLAVLVLVHLVMWGLYVWFGETAPGERVLSGMPDRTRSRGPALEIAPRSELEAHRRREEELLESYGWVDREKGLVRIPIDRAMELYLRDRRGREEP